MANIPHKKKQTISRIQVKSKCIYCGQLKSISQFSREHVLPRAFGRFKNALVLHDAVCKDCNQYFGDTIDKSLARGSMQGAIRYFSGIKPLHKFKNIDKKRVQLFARTNSQSTLREAEFVKTLDGEGLAFTSGISYMSISNNKEEFVSLTTLEKGNWNKANDIDSQHHILISYSDTHILERIKKSLEQYNCDVEILDTIESTQVGQKVQAEVDGIVEDILLYRAIAKIAFNYLTHKMGRDFVLKPIFDKTRTFIRQGNESDTIVRKISPINIYGDREEAQRRRGHIVAIELADDDATLVGFVEFFRVISYKVTLGKFGQLAIPISQAHYFDIISKKVFTMDAIRRPLGFWLPK